MAAVVAGLGAAAVLAFVLVRGDDDGETGGLPSSLVRDEPGPVHVHGLGVNPKDGALFIATHTGLWRTAPDAVRAERVTDRMQDTMGFTVLGADRFLGSGHPDPREDLPPLLGLIESNDAGRSWRPVSLLGEADFHVLRARGRHVYGFDASRGRLLASDDGGRTWMQRRVPASLFDLAPHPRRDGFLVAATDRGLFASSDDGKTWRRRSSRVGLLAWPQPERLYLVDPDGHVFASPDGGHGWSARGSIGGEPAAFTANGRDLYAALHDGTVKRSSDGGRRWTIRSTPS